MSSRPLERQKSKALSAIRKIRFGLEQQEEALRKQKEGLKELEDVVAGTDLNLVGTVVAQMFVKAKGETNQSETATQQNVQEEALEVAVPKRMKVGGKVYYSCPRCADYPPHAGWGTVLSHINKEHLKKLYVCQHCDKFSCYNPDVFGKHMRKAHPEEQ